MGTASSPEAEELRRKRISERCKAKRQTAEYRRQQSERMKEVYNPDTPSGQASRAAKSEAMTLHHAEHPEHAEAMSQAMTKKWQDDPEYAKKVATQNRRRSHEKQIGTRRARLEQKHAKVQERIEMRRSSRASSGNEEPDPES